MQTYKLSNVLSFSKETLLQTFSPWFVCHLPEIMYAKHWQQETKRPPVTSPRKKAAPPPSRKKKERTPPSPGIVVICWLRSKLCNNIELTRKIIDTQFSITFKDIQLTKILLLIFVVVGKCSLQFLWHLKCFSSQHSGSNPVIYFIPQ